MKLKPFSRTNTMPAETIPYELVVSSRASRCRIKIDPGRGVIVTVPRQFPLAKVSQFVKDNESWIRSTSREIEEKIPAHYRHWPPQTLILTALSKQLTLVFDQNCPGPFLENHAVLAIQAHPDQKQKAAKLVANYLKEVASEILPGKLAHFSERFELTYRRCQIRGQRTVWGSYSSNGTVSLNYKLLFLPVELVDYVLIHELVHSRYLNHSDAFWRLLEKVLPKAISLDQKLKTAGVYVPPWLDLAK